MAKLTTAKSFTRVQTLTPHLVSHYLETRSLFPVAQTCLFLRTRMVTMFLIKRKFSIRESRDYSTIMVCTLLFSALMDGYTSISEMKANLFLQLLVIPL